MNFLATLLLISSALAASSELPTYSSSIVSTASCDDSSCVPELVPTSFAYSNTTVGRVVVGSSSSEEDRPTIYEYETVTDDDLYDVVQTVCDIYSNCYATTDIESFTTYTTTVDGILTVVTTAVPYVSLAGEIVDPESTTTESEITTTLASTITATITSCDEVCYTTTEEQVLTTETSTVNGVETVYTTYCPLTAEKAVSTETDISETVITITSCHENKCSKVPVTTGLTTVTEDNTVYTTYCPLSGETTATTGIADFTETSSTTGTTETTKAPAQSTATEESTTVVTITSCHENKCSKVPVTTGLTTITEDNTIYTTYCPLSSVAKPPAPGTTTSTGTVPTTSTGTTTSASTQKTVDVITNNIVTQTPEGTPTTVLYSATSQVTIPNSEVYEGAGALAQTGAIAIVFSILLSFF